MTTTAPVFKIHAQSETSIILEDNDKVVILQDDETAEGGVIAIAICGRANLDQIIAALLMMREGMA